MGEPDDAEIDMSEIPSLDDEIEFQREAAKMMEDSRPQDEMYFQVAGTTRIIETQEELERMNEQGVQLVYVSYNRAVYCIEKNRATSRAREGRRAKSRCARAARRRNRGR